MFGGLTGFRLRGSSPDIFGRTSFGPRAVGGGRDPSTAERDSNGESRSLAQDDRVKTLRMTGGETMALRVGGGASACRT